MSSDKLLEKAEKLLKSGRVEFLGEGKFNVVGDHGTYLVAQDHEGNLSCNCLGFLRRKKCSHQIAVLLKTRSNRKRRFKTTRD